MRGLSEECLVLRLQLLGPQGLPEGREAGGGGGCSHGKTTGLAGWLGNWLGGKGGTSDPVDTQRKTGRGFSGQGQGPGAD